MNSWLGQDTETSVVLRSSDSANPILRGTLKGKEEEVNRRDGDNITEWTGVEFSSSARAA